MGGQRLDELPLSTRLLREMHRRLMDGVRGRDLAPGELRTTQNWIGPAGLDHRLRTVCSAAADELPALLSDWERFANEEPEMPVLVQDALLHAQFETIHPFLDGNGRLGRLMLVFFLVARGRLTAPLLYLSAYLERHARGLLRRAPGDPSVGGPSPWVDLFLTSVKVEAGDAVAAPRRSSICESGTRDCGFPREPPMRSRSSI